MRWLRTISGCAGAAINPDLIGVTVRGGAFDVKGFVLALILSAWVVLHRRGVRGEGEVGGGGESYKPMASRPLAMSWKWEIAHAAAGGSARAADRGWRSS